MSSILDIQHAYIKGIEELVEGENERINVVGRTALETRNQVLWIATEGAKRMLPTYQTIHDESPRKTERRVEEARRLIGELERAIS